MTPSARELVRIELDRAGTPDDAPARRLAGVDVPHADTADVDGCVRCAQPWWSCLCDPSRASASATPDAIESARHERLTRAERDQSSGPWFFGEPFMAGHPRVCAVCRQQIRRGETAIANHDLRQCAHLGCGKIDSRGRR